jgi:hypothetical protein
VLPRPQLIFPSKTWFWGIHLNFQRQKSLQNQYLPHSESKSFYQINSTKSLLIKMFPTRPKADSNSSEIFSHNLVKKIIQYSRTFAPQVQMSWNQKPLHSSSSSKAFQRHQEHNLKHPGLVDLIPTKQSKLPYFIDRYIQMELISSVTITCPTMG